MQVGPPTLITLAELLVRNAALPESDAGANPWLRHLVQSRYIVLLPISNAVGYDHLQREEIDIDPNRDFPFNVLPGRCMRSYVGRAINEVWLRHMFQLSVTYHGGMQAIAYEWGSLNHMVRGPLLPFAFCLLPVACCGCLLLVVCVCLCVRVCARVCWCVIVAATSLKLHAFVSTCRARCRCRLCRTMTVSLPMTRHRLASARG